jgi:hypothetical protein
VLGPEDEVRAAAQNAVARVAVLELHVDAARAEHAPHDGEVVLELVRGDQDRLGERLQNCPQSPKEHERRAQRAPAHACDRPDARPDLDRPEDPGRVALAGAVAVQLVELELDRFVQLQVLLVEAPRLLGRALGPARHRARAQPLRARDTRRRHSFHDELHGLVEVSPRTTHAIVGRPARGDKGPLTSPAQVSNSDSAARGQTRVADHTRTSRGMGDAGRMGAARAERGRRLHRLQSPPPLPIGARTGMGGGASERAQVVGLQDLPQASPTLAARSARREPPARTGSSGPTRHSVASPSERGFAIRLPSIL